MYGGWSRGFRSGGFNQTGVGAVAAADGQKGVHDEFDAEIADTWEVGVKSEFLDHRLRVNATYFNTTSQNGYFFFYDASTSTQNLGNLDAKYHGGELEVTAKPTDRLDLYAGVGLTDSKITAMEDPSVIGNQAPLVSRNTINAGAQYRQPLSDRLNGIIRLDYQEIGRTYWDPYNVTSRDPVSLVDLRTSLEADNWSITAWSKNLTNKIYNAEFSTGGFLWRALPRRYASTSSITSDAMEESSTPFRFYDNRQKYLAFVTTCNEKSAIARRATHEVSLCGRRHRRCASLMRAWETARSSHV